MKLYIQVREDDVVTDVITYPYGNYMEIEHEVPLPDGVLGGWHKWDGTTFVFDQALYDTLHPEPIEPYNESADMQSALSLLGVEPEEA